MASEFQGQFQEAMREAEMADLKKQAEDLKSSVSDLTSFDPMASTKKESRAPSCAPKSGRRANHPPMRARCTGSLAEPQQQQKAQDVNVLLPEPLSPVSEKDFAPAEVPPPKQAGGGG